MRADVGVGTRFVAEPRTLGALFVAEVEEERVTGAALLRLEDGGGVRETRAAPWVELEPPPRMALAASGVLLGATARAAGKAGSEVSVWRAAGADAGGAVESLGSGDGFDVVDVGCGAARCALLTTRLGKVAAPGAEVRVGGPGEAVVGWKRVEIAPAKGDSDAEPALIAAVEPKIVVAIAEGTEVAFFDADATPPPEIARLPAEAGLLDAATAHGRSVALVHGAPVGEDGCTKGVPALRIERSGGAGIAVSTPAAPLVAALRPLADGFLAVWLAPLGCGAARRVVYGLVLGQDGTPVGDPLPIADGTAFAVASAGADADVFIRHEPPPQSQTSPVTWLRMTCGKP